MADNEVKTEAEEIKQNNENEELRTAEIKLEMWKLRYEKEIMNFDETVVNNILKNSGAKEYIERQKAKNKLKDETISQLKTELERTRNELVVWKNKCRELEEQSNVHWKAWKDTQLKNVELEAEKKAAEEKEKRISATMNLSSASSMALDQIPPPPPVDIPTPEEYLSRLSTYSTNI